MKERRQFTQEFKNEAVELLLSSGRRPSDVAKELGIDPVLLSKWARDQQKPKPRRAAGSKAEGQRTVADLDARIAQLEREKARLQMEHEILKKTVSIFSGTRR